MNNHNSAAKDNALRIAIEAGRRDDVVILGPGEPRSNFVSSVAGLHADDAHDANSDGEKLLQTLPTVAVHGAGHSGTADPFFKGQAEQIVRRLKLIDQIAGGEQ